jgi:hypothetical protein
VELSVSPVKQGGVRIAKTVKTEVTVTKAEAGTANSDRLELSRAAMNWVETLNDRNYQEQEQEAALQQKIADYTNLSQQLGDVDDTADAPSESLRVMNRCMKIASNIMSGKQVPLKDQRYLMEHDSKMYQLAMAMRRPSKDDEKCDPVVKDEDEESSSGETAAGAEETVSSPEASADGGAAAAPSEGGETAE